jgi:hypothetical protein
MICRRGGIDKDDIGAIRVMDTTTEFEISARAADKFVGNLRRPDKGRQYSYRAACPMARKARVA